MKQDWWDTMPLWHEEMSFLTDLVGNVPWAVQPWPGIFERHGMTNDDVMVLYRKLRAFAEGEGDEENGPSHPYGRVAQPSGDEVAG